ncbi:MAG TPA: hypothetical protein VI997_04780 [Candidatus Thermoplasmatota archaeon]|nr:hypothetical protein [Candidatus Thermoplasmatota archaeon]
MTRLPLVAALGILAASAAAAYALYANASPDGLAVASAAAGTDATASDPIAWQHAVPWEGYARVGAADRFAHTQETEPLVAPLARMGFDVDVPEGTTALAFRLTWPAGARMHLMAHGPGEGMPTFMGGHDASGTMCIRVPDADVAAGTWKVMAHVDEDARDLKFTIETLANGPQAPTLPAGTHGHPMMDDMQMDMQEPGTC